MKAFAESLERRTLLAGELDTGFGANGVTTGNFDQFSERFTEVTIAPDGKIVAAGFIGGGYLVARFTASGQLDTSFNGTGFVQTGTTNYEAGGVAVSPAGKVYVGGSKYIASGINNAYIAAFNANGTPDTTFDGDGVWQQSWTGENFNDIVGMTYLQGRLYVGWGDSRNLGIARFTDSGTLDTAFDGDGKNSLPFTATTVAAQDYFFAANATTPAFYVAGMTNGSGVIAKFNLNGSRDIGFSTTPFATDFGIHQIGVDQGGRVYAGGSRGRRATVARLTSSGAVDTTFATSGFFTSTDTNEVSATSLAVDDFGVIFTASNGGSGVGATSAATALTQEGVKNLTFGNAGRLVVPIALVGSAVRQNDGKIILVGRQTIGGDQVDTKIVRLNPAPAPTQISGSLFDDVNGDGIQNDVGGSTTFYGITTYLDLDGDAVMDDAEPKAYAGSGKFEYNNLAPGTYSVRLHIYSTTPAVQTRPSGNGGFTITTTGAFNNVGPFGVKFVMPTTAVAGRVFNDLDADGIFDSDEAGLQGGTIFDDVDGDGALDAGETNVTTDIGGQFTINLTTGNHFLRHLPPSGYRATGQSLATPVSGSTFATNNVLRVPTDTSMNQVRFGEQWIPVTGASASGVVFNDADQNGTKGTGEAGLSGVTAYIDLDNDKVLDANERSTTTDGNGAFAFTNLPDTGSVTRLRIVLPAGGTQTTPANGFGYSLAFGVGVTNTNKNFGLYLVPADTTPPTVALSYSNLAEQAVTIQFSESVAGSFTASDLVLKNTTTNTTVAASDLTLTSLPGNAYKLTYKTGAATTPLPRGRYTLTIAGTVTDGAGNALAATPAISFVVQPGDVTGDGKTDFSDLVILAQNYGQSGKTFAQGNVDYSTDGKVDFNDLVLLAQAYGQSLGATVLAPVADAGLSMKRRNVAGDVLA